MNNYSIYKLVEELSFLSEQTLQYLEQEIHHARCTQYEIEQINTATCNAQEEGMYL